MSTDIRALRQALTPDKLIVGLALGDGARRQFGGIAHSRRPACSLWSVRKCSCRGYGIAAFRRFIL